MQGWKELNSQKQKQIDDLREEKGTLAERVGELDASNRKAKDDISKINEENLKNLREVIELKEEKTQIMNENKSFVAEI